MDLLTYFLFGAVIGCIYIILTVPQKIIERKKYKYIAKKDIMTNSEKIFYNKLDMICGDNIVIFPQIHLSAIFDHRVKGQNWKHAFWRVNQKSVDFLLCSKETLKPLVAIELDDHTHKRYDRIERDEIVNEIFENSTIPLLRFNNVKTDNKIIKSKIISCLRGRYDD